MSGTIVVSGIGAITPVGAGAAQTCASIRAGLSGLRRHPTYYPIPTEPLVEAPELVACALAAGDPTQGDRAERLLRMSVAATRDLVAATGLTRAETSALELVLCLGGGDRRGVPPPDQDGFATEVPRRLGIALQQAVRTVTGGSAIVFQALSDAGARLAARQVERCLILAVDSLVDEESLLWLDACERLRSARNADGLLPGEAAACFLLEREEVVLARGGSVLALVAGVGVGAEPNTITGQANSTGRGLCDSIQAATSSWGEQPVPWAVCDMTGESYGAYEWGLARARMGEILGATDLWHPADCVGAVGTAASALSLVLAARALACEYATADRALLWCASDDSKRAACALNAPGSMMVVEKRR